MCAGRRLARAVSLANETEAQGRVKVLIWSQIRQPRAALIWRKSHHFHFLEHSLLLVRIDFSRILGRDRLQHLGSGTVCAHAWRCCRCARCTTFRGRSALRRFWGRKGRKTHPSHFLSGIDEAAFSKTFPMRFARGVPVFPPALGEGRLGVRDTCTRRVQC